MIGDTDLMCLARDVMSGRRDSRELLALIPERCSALNLPARGSGDTVLHIVARGASVSKADLILRALLDHGANPFVCNNEGKTPVDVALAGDEGEVLVSVLTAYRNQEMNQIRPVAPLFASRLMKRSAVDTGAASFSTVAPHCAYYSYKGGIFLWDVLADVDHVIFDPREESTQLQQTEKEYAQFLRRRSTVAFGGTDLAFDPSAGSGIQAKLKAAENALPIVSNFCVFSGTEVIKDPLPLTGVSEWIITNTGLLIAVRLARNGIRLVHGQRSLSSSRHKSDFCAGTATYPEGKVPDVTIYRKCGVQFAKREAASQVCCAVDGTFGVFGYVVATRSGRRQRLEDSMGSLAVVSPGDTEPAMAASRSVRDVKWTDTYTSSPTSPGSRQTEGALTGDIPSPGGGGPAHVSVYNQRPDTPLFRVFKFKDMSPKDGFNDCVRSLVGSTIAPPFARTFVAETHVSASLGDPLGVFQCRPEFMLLVLTEGIMCASIDPMQDHSKLETLNPTAPALGDRQHHITFADVVLPLPRDGPIKHVASLGPPRFRTIRPNAIQYHIAIFTTVVDVYQVHKGATGNCVFVPVLRIPPDRCTPHEFIPLFHPIEDQLILMYHSLQRQEINVHHFIPHRLQQVCKLPKPSSLRFYTTTNNPLEKSLRRLRSTSNAAEVNEDEPKLPQLSFAISRDGKYFLRYNVTMHVLSVYGWDEVAEEMSRGPYRNMAYIREPIPPKSAMKSSKYLTAATPRTDGASCVWLIADCSSLTDIQLGAGLDCRSATLESTRATRQFIDTCSATIGQVFGRTVIGYQGTKQTYTAPPFTFRPKNDEEAGMDDEDIAELEKEYYDRLPYDPCVWAANFANPLDAVRCAIRLQREWMRAPWSEEVLRDERFAPQQLAYVSKTVVEKCYPHAVVEDVDAASTLIRGPCLRTYVCAGRSDSVVGDLLMTTRAQLPRELDGVVVTTLPVTRVVRSLSGLFVPYGECPTVTIGSCQVLVPPELHGRLLQSAIHHSPTKSL